MAQITDLTVETVIADGDYVPFRKTAATRDRRILWSDIQAQINNLPLTTGDGVGVLKKSAVRWLHDFAPPSALGPNLFLGPASGNFTMTVGGGTGSSYLIGIGYNSLSENTTGTHDCVVGHNALYHNTTGNSNAGIGINFLRTNTTGSFNSGCGVDVLYDNVSGIENAGIGYGALRNLIDGNGNQGLGTYSMYATENGDYNTMAGHSAGWYVNGDYNTALGYKALNRNATGSNNLSLGAYAGQYELSASNTFYLDNQDRVNTAGEKAGAMFYGEFNATVASQWLRLNGNFGLGVSTPTAKLQFVANTVAAGGILFGADTNLYRSAVDTLKTDDVFVVGAAYIYLNDITGTKIGGGPTGALDINYNNAKTGALSYYGGGTGTVFSVNSSGTVTCAALRINQTPAAETPTPTHTVIVSLNGVNYKIPCVAA